MRDAAGGPRRAPPARARAHLGPTAVRRLRIGAASALVVAIIAGGAAALWLASRAHAPGAATSRAEHRTGPPPVRLDTLAPRTRPGATAASAAGPLEDRSRPRQGARGGTHRGGKGRTGPSAADIRRAIAALAAENAVVEAALRGYRGPDPGTGEIIWPVDGRVLLRFGWLWGYRHAGIDIAAPVGTAVHAADWGRVVLAGTRRAYGKYVCIQHTQIISTCYAHNSRLRVHEGQHVDTGDVIASSGCTGSCYAPHLQFEVRENGRPVNPRRYLGPPLTEIR